jgi:hypothetical protein
LLKHNFPKQPSAEPEHEPYAYNNILCQPEAFLLMWRDIIYKAYGEYAINLLKELTVKQGKK